MLLDELGADMASGELSSLVDICIQHLTLALQVAGRGRQAQALLRPATGCLRLLHAELNEYIRRQDYRFLSKPGGAESDAPWRAIARRRSKGAAWD